MKTNYFFKTCLFLSVLFSFATTATAQTIHYVKPTASGTGDGTSWANASADLHDMISSAAVDDEIWVAEGNYKPIKDRSWGTSNTRSFIFLVNKDVKIYGGFENAGTPTFLDRDASAYPTILDGEIGTPNVNTDNIKRIMEIDATVASGGIISNDCVVDGFTFQNAYAEPDAFPNSYGSALHINGRGTVSGIECNPTISNCIFTNNYTEYGGAIFVSAYLGVSSPKIMDCTFTSNTANHHSGGLYLYAQDGSTFPEITDCVFNNNESLIGDGGAVTQYTYNGVVNPSYTNCTFDNNTAHEDGGAAHISCDLGTSNSTFTNCSFTNNSATNNTSTSSNGGAIYNDARNSGIVQGTYKNCTFENNYAKNDGGAIYEDGENYTSEQTMDGCIFKDNSCGGHGGAIYFFGDGGNIASTIDNTIFDSNGSNHLAYDDGNSAPTFTNCNFYGATSQVAIKVELNNSQAPMTFVNCIFWNNNNDIADDNQIVSISYSIVEEASFGGVNNNINSDPLFTDAANGDFSLQSGSPAIDAGDDAAMSLTTDFAGNLRKIGTVDMGPYEYGSVPLPVELLSFTTVTDDKVIVLDWITASELNNAGFEIERSANGIDFEPINWVEGKGTTLEVSDYQLIDEKPFNGVNYYRLRQVDFDGQFEYSNIVEATIKQSATAAINVYPNPMHDYIMVENGQGIATIYNILGQPIKTFTINNSQEKIEVADLPNGHYLLHVKKDDGTMSNTRIIKK